MTFRRFKQLWQALITDAPPVKDPVMVDHGTPIANEELAKWVRGKPSKLSRDKHK